MPTSPLYHNTYAQLSQHLPKALESQIETMSLVLVGVIQSISSQLAKIARAMPLDTTQAAKEQRLRRLLDNERITQADHYHPVVTQALHGLKTHAKLLLIVRKEADGLRRYVHLGTGNYNAGTARLYTDLGLLSADEALGADVSELFNVLTGYSDQIQYRKLLVALHTLHRALLDKVAREVERHVANGDGHLIFKCNGLTDEAMTLALYRAAQAGVRVDLIIRGVCSARPGILGLSETMQVRSIVGRFLEHHRVYWFHNGGQEELYLGSADLMERNLHKRVETLFPIEHPRLRAHLRETVLEAYLSRTSSRTDPA
jgi:polyphosphate kinase